MDKLSKSKQKQYDAFERRVTDIFNGATGNGYAADEWVDSEFVTLEDVASVMSAIECTFDLSAIYKDFKLGYFHAKYFEQPRIAAEWLWEHGVRK